MTYFLACALVLGSVLNSDSAPVDEPPAEEVEVVLPVPVIPPTPRAYLYENYPGIAPRMDCVIQRESRWTPGAQNPHSTAGGLAQILLSTWLSTPQGQRGESRFNPYANIDGAAWLVTAGGGWRHWAATVGGC